MSAERTATATGRRSVPRQRPSRAARRFGYAVACLVNAALLYAINRWPGWEAVPFLTDRTTEVLTAVNASLVVGIVVNLVWVWADPPRVRALGDALTTLVGLVALVTVWRVFPVDLSAGWEAVARLLLVLGIVGSLIAVVTALVRLGRGR